MTCKGKFETEDILLFLNYFHNFGEPGNPTVCLFLLLPLLLPLLRILMSEKFLKLSVTPFPLNFLIGTVRENKPGSMHLSNNLDGQLYWW